MKKAIKVVAVGLALLGLQACGFEIVDTGHRGVETRWGEVVGEPLPEGLHFYNPVTSNIIELNVQVQRWEHESIAFTKDVQQAAMKITLNYNLDPSVAHIMFRDVGHSWASTLIPQVVEGTLKEVVGKWEAVELIEKRDRAASEAFTQIKNDLALKGIQVSNFEINNVDYSDDFERAVEAKVTAIQKAIEEQNRTIQIKEQAKQKVISATAEAQSMRIRANALTQNKALVEYEAVQKWDGKMPQYMMGGAVPFIKLDPSK